MKQAKPNIVYILADDMGYGDVSCLNAESKIRTPHLDSIAQHGLAFTDAHSSSSVCTPSRYSILTGRYNWRSTLKSGVLGGYSPALISPQRKTVGHLLQEQGYTTLTIGKWHLGMDFPITQPASSPGELPEVDFTAPISHSVNSRGFDYYFGISASLDMPPYVYIENDRFLSVPTKNTQGTGMQFWREGPTADDFQHEEVFPKLTQKVCQAIREHQDQPFFLYYPMPAPHTPILPLEKYQDSTQTNPYGDFVAMCDAMVGQVLDTLKETDQWENTIVIYTSDNGCSPQADFPALEALGHYPSHHFRGHKADIFEGGHRIPYLLQWPAKIPAGKVCDQTVCLTDLMATLAEGFEISLPDNTGEDSISNLSLWYTPDSAPVREDTVHQSIDGSLALRQGDYKLCMCPGSGGWSSPKPGEEPPGLPEFQLYNLRQDIGETENLITKEPQRYQALRERLLDIIQQGRSTPGMSQKNDGSPVWDTVQWITENNTLG